MHALGTGPAAVCVLKQATSCFQANKRKQKRSGSAEPALSQMKKPRKQAKLETKQLDSCPVECPSYEEVAAAADHRQDAADGHHAVGKQQEGEVSAILESFQSSADVKDQALALYINAKVGHSPCAVSMLSSERWRQTQCARLQAQPGPSGAANCKPSGHMQCTCCCCDGNSNKPCATLTRGAASAVVLQLFPEVAAAFANFLWRGMTSELAAALIVSRGEDRREKLFDLFAPYALQAFSKEIQQYRCSAFASCSATPALLFTELSPGPHRSWRHVLHCKGNKACTGMSQHS